MRSLAMLISLLACAIACGQFTPSGPVNPDGGRATIDIPKEKHIRNTGGIDGLGLCVFTSIQHAGYWQNIDELEGFRKFMEGQPGGGYPSKVDAMIKKFAAAKNLEIPAYIQHEGGEVEFLEAVLKTDRIVSVTYAGVDDFYRGQVIAHMVNLAHLDEKWAAIIDNNRPGVWVWMSRAAFLNRWRGLSDSGRPLTIQGDRVGGGWAIAFLKSPPPPYKINPGVSVEQCFNGRCLVRPTPVSPELQTETQLFTGWEEKSDRFIRWDNGKYRGVVVKETKKWHAADPAGSMGWQVTASNIPDDLTNPAEKKNDIPTGVDYKQLVGAVRYTMTGAECKRSQVFSALVSGGLPDDSDRYHLTIVGNADLFASVRRDLQQLPTDARNKFHVQYYRPDHWAVTQFDLPAGVSLRDPSPGRVGKEIGVGTVQELAVRAGLIPDPNPKPEPIPDQPNSKASATRLLPIVGWIVAIVLGVVLLTRRK